jgi:hypothetical protein
MNTIIRAVSCGRLVTVLAVCAAWGSLEAQAQTASPPPARENPRPQDIDPAVDTSRPAADSGAASQTPQLPPPQDVKPGVDTSAERKPAPSAGAAGANGAVTAGATGTPQPGGAARTQVKGRALDRLELDTTQITGNRELPKVLYIVPWKRADLGDLVGKPVNSLLDEVLTPVDRDVFKRENRYYRALMPEGAAPAAQGAAGSASGSAGAPAPAAKDER